MASDQDSDLVKQPDSLTKTCSCIMDHVSWTFTGGIQSSSQGIPRMSPELEVVTSKQVLAGSQRDAIAQVMQWL